MKGLLFIFFAGFATISHAQAVIQGHVVDAQTNTPLPGTNVYIANTTHGTVTDAEGAFRIDGIQPGHYKIIVSFIGYGTQVIDVSTSVNAGYRILLRPSAQQLKEIVVHSKKHSRGDWVANFNLFKEHFIGTSDNYRSCTFENPRVLDFSKKGYMLTATADSTLVIENRGLGYRVKIFLEKYEFNTMLIRTHYEGQIIFEELVPRDETEELQWAKARLKAYYGSEMQFFRALYHHRLNQEGFFFNLIQEENFGKRGGIKRIGYADSVKTPRSAIYNYKPIKVHTLVNYNRILDSLTSTPEQPVLKFKGELDIQYIHEAESSSYQQARHHGYGKNPQVSQVKLLKPCIIQLNGQVYPLDGIETSGYWSWELVAESLPLNYDPEADEELTGFKILSEGDHH